MGWAGKQAMARIWLLLRVRGEPQEGPEQRGQQKWGDMVRLQVDLGGELACLRDTLGRSLGREGCPENAWVGIRQAGRVPLRPPCPDMRPKRWTRTHKGPTRESGLSGSGLNLCWAAGSFPPVSLSPGRGAGATLILLTFSFIIRRLTRALVGSGRWLSGGGLSEPCRGER